MAHDVPSYVLESLTLVGPAKSVGYLPIQTVTQVLGLNVGDVITQAMARGLKAILIGPHHCCIKSGALYVFDAVALEAVLRVGAVTLEQVSAPADPEMFVRFVARDWFAPDHPIMPIIRAAFADNARSAPGREPTSVTPVHGADSCEPRTASPPRAQPTPARSTPPRRPRPARPASAPAT